MSDKPAILGGKPIFDEKLPIVRPNAYLYWNSSGLKRLLDKMFHTEKLSSVGNYVLDFEKEFAQFVGAEYAVALSSCTSGLILAIQALGAADREVIIPSYTFSATAHAAKWNRCTLKFAEIDDTLTIDVDDVENIVTDKTALIIAVHTYGLPCDVLRLEAISKERGIPVLYDAAHAVGASISGMGVGSFGAASAFSFSPTKLMTTVEGGLLSTNDKKLSEMISLDRNYSSKKDCERPGLSARMGEWNAALALSQLRDPKYRIEDFVDNRSFYAFEYTRLLEGLPGISYQEIPYGYQSSHKDFCIFIDPDEFGMTRVMLSRALEAENIETKYYFYPPVHKMELYKGFADRELPITVEKSERVLSLPIYNIMKAVEVERVAKAIRRIQKHSIEITKAID